ncbi:alpha/beta hydrolase [Streptomyces sp. NPDC006923]|uniref:alpha/beta hydrolase n=1 Tax=Streptomyces sp. NPDC006923 TaxID=3155355 RepID=UPI0033DDC06B
MASRPHGSRPRRTRPRRAAKLPPGSRHALAVLVMASVVVPLLGAARPAAVPAAAPAVLSPLRAATPAVLDERYAASRAGIRAAGSAAAGHGDRSRAAVLRAMADPARHFLSFDGRDGGRTVEVFGDLSGAGRIAVLVPGSDTSLDRYGRLRAGASALRRELGGGAAVIAWLGYRTPATVSPQALTPGLADEAAPRLRAFVAELTDARPGARVSLLCHSYGSVVCAGAAHGLRVADIVLYGSPGTGVDHAGRLRTGATVWAGRGDGDWMAEVPHARLRLPCLTVGFGADPVSKGFGARVFDAGPGGHSDYLRPGSVSLRNLARIVSGRTPSGRTPSGQTSSGERRDA